jgi:hypothetical protein
MPTSQARIEAARRNGRKSNGPTSAAGRRRSSLNALKHGLCSAKSVLPSEDPAEFRERIVDVHCSLVPRHPMEALLADDVAHTSWLYHRALRAQNARITKKINDSSFEHEMLIDGLTRRLFFDRRGSTSLYGVGRGNGCGGRTSYSGIPDDPDDPARLICLISRSSYGCKWMLSCWNEMRELIVTGRTWQAAHRLRATRLMGRQPLDACLVEDVAQVFLRSWTINPERENAWREHRSELRREEYHRFCQRLRGQHGLLNSHDKAQERATLVSVIDKVIAGVKEKLALAEAREVKDAAIEADCLAFDDSPEGERLRRYELAAHRKFLRTIDAFTKLRKAGFEPELDSENVDENNFPADPSNAGALPVVDDDDSFEQASWPMDQPLDASVAEVPAPSADDDPYAAIEDDDDPSAGCDELTATGPFDQSDAIAPTVPITTTAGIDTGDQDTAIDTRVSSSHAVENLRNEPTGRTGRSKNSTEPIIFTSKPNNVDAIVRSSKASGPKALTLELDKVFWLAFTRRLLWSIVLLFFCTRLVAGARIEKTEIEPVSPSPSSPIRFIAGWAPQTVSSHCEDQSTDSIGPEPCATIGRPPSPDDCPRSECLSVKARASHERVSCRAPCQGPE